jgi:hypothetical protein
MMTPDEAAQEVFDQMNGDAFHKAFPFVFGLLFRFSRLPAHGPLPRRSSSAGSLTSIKDDAQAGSAELWVGADRETR